MDDDEQFYDKYRQYLQEHGRFPNEQQLAQYTAASDDATTDDQLRRNA